MNRRDDSHWLLKCERGENFYATYFYSVKKITSFHHGHGFLRRVFFQLSTIIVAILSSLFQKSSHYIDSTRLVKSSEAVF